MSGPPPPPPPPGPPPPPAAMAPPAISKKEQQGRSALLGDISKGMQLKSSKHLMNDKSNPLLNAKGGNEAKTRGNGGTIPVPVGVKNAPPGLGGIFSGGIPKLKSTTGEGTVSKGSQNRLSNGIDVPPPPPPLSSKPSVDYTDSVGRSGGSRMSGLPPPPPELLSSPRPMPGSTPKLPSPSLNTRPPVPGPAPPPPPSRIPPPVKPSSSSNENGVPGHGNVRCLPPTPGHLPPPPPTRMDSASAVRPPLQPPSRNPGPALPPPPPVRGPPNGQPANVGRPTQPTKIVHQQSQTSAPPPPPPPGRPPPLNRNNSVQNNNCQGGDFEANFIFSKDLPRPDSYRTSTKIYPSQKDKTNNGGNRRPCPPPPPPGGL